ncbi:hypothetical protein [Nocardiopsis alkaliphila]|uniref:hypothetical protein n=1 Tax=Nocardiopsis alkaliphila TaxID=225762 RepID=UPI00034D0437|nr:hypothetical protein [Nocardiopsis alkaliphila]
MKRVLLVGAALALATSACGDQDVPGEGERPSMDRTEQEVPQDRTDRDGGDGRDDGAVEGDDHIDGSTGGEDGEVRVLNYHGDENGFDDQRPQEYVIGHSTTFSAMEWKEWSRERARGGGVVLGTWCMDQGCQDDPYDIEVELGDPVEANGALYFSTFTITEYDDMPEEQRDALEQVEGGRLGVPTGQD